MLRAGQSPSRDGCEPNCLADCCSEIDSSSGLCAARSAPFSAEPGFAPRLAAEPPTAHLNLFKHIRRLRCASRHAVAEPEGTALIGMDFANSVFQLCLPDLPIMQSAIHRSLAMLDQSRSSRKHPSAALLSTLALLTSAAPAFAHHAFSAEFDSEAPVEVKGTVTKFDLVNPHSWIYLDVKNPSGSVTSWGFEFGAPFALKEKGLTKSSFPAGSEITIKGFRAKSGKDFGYAVNAILADGRSFETGGAQGAPAVVPSPAAAATPAAR
jgi:hypothetical protein